MGRKVQQQPNVKNQVNGSKSKRKEVVDGTAGLGQTLRAGRPPVGGLTFHGVSGLCMSSLAHRLPSGIQAQGMRIRPMQAWASCSHTTWVALSVASSVGPTLTTVKQTTISSVHHGDRCRNIPSPECQARPFASSPPSIIHCNQFTILFDSTAYLSRCFHNRL